MNDKEKINVENMKIIAKNINDKMDSINSLYKKKIEPILDNSINCLNFSNANSEEIRLQFEKDFFDLNTISNDCNFVLVNEIIPSYENLSSNLTVLFKKEFSNNLNALLESDEITEDHNE